ncbi:hypothetical protein FRB99_006140 [Tulasnella sp. 403]|nr:hypothetical protein FRB99_006140 [Tulasnella sp. 403]
MAPPKTTSKPLAQRTLSFTTKKTATSSTSAKDKATSAVPKAAVTRLQSASDRKVLPIPSKKPVAKHVEDDSDSEDEIDDADYIEISSESEGLPEPIEVVQETKEPALPGLKKHDISSSEEEEEDVVPSKGKRITLTTKELVKEKEFKDAYSDAKQRVAGELTASAQGEPKAKTILRVFDLSYDYGPCVGMTRMERWQRASKLGLDPPEIVRLILETEKVEDLTDQEVDALRQSVFYGMV